MIGEGSRGVSGGQAQRIALARAFLDSSRRVLLFDEPTAHLDIETEAALKQDMLPLMDDHLVFFATHRLHWINQMDYVLVMEHGELVEQGTLVSSHNTMAPIHGYAQKWGVPNDSTNERNFCPRYLGHALFAQV